MEGETQIPVSKLFQHLFLVYEVECCNVKQPSYRNSSEFAVHILRLHARAHAHTHLHTIFQRNFVPLLLGRRALKMEAAGLIRMLQAVCWTTYISSRKTVFRHFDSPRYHKQNCGCWLCEANIIVSFVNNLLDLGGACVKFLP